MLRRALFVALIAAFAAAAAPAGAQIQRRDAFKEGNWQGFASYDGIGFTHCVVSAPPANGWTMLITMRDPANLRLAFGNDKLALKAGNTIELKLTPDLKPEVTQRFSVINPKLMFVATEPESAWFKEIRQARTLKLAIGSASQTFTLGALDAAVNKLADCVRKNAKRPG